MTLFVINSVLFGIGLAMDAFSVSLANGLNEPKMKKAKLFGIAATFAFFQIIMPFIGWFCVHTVEKQFSVVQPYIPFVALALLGYIGGKMIWEGLHPQGEEEPPKVGFWGLMVQGVATSIDALSVGFTIAQYSVTEALAECLIIGGVTFLICVAGVIIGKKAGTVLAGKASVFGGIILVLIGLEIVITSLMK